MPVKFHCQHCDSTLSVSSRKVGQKVTCPRCHQFATVPFPDATSALAEQPIKSTTELAPKGAAPEPLAETLPATALPLPPPPPPDYDDAPGWNSGEDEVTWVYESEQPTHAYDPQAALIDYDKVALPRYVLYGQGALLGVVAFVSLLLGILIGRGTTPTVQVAGPAKPCNLTGKVSYLSSSGNKVPDAGAVVIVLPKGERPAEKAPIEGLRPGDPLPGDDQPSLSRIKGIGGDYTRANEQGEFKVRVPSTGDYFVLVLAKGAARKQSDTLNRDDLAEMGRYFLPAPDLIGDRKYLWQTESIKRDKHVQFTLE